jgi:glycosyltransferase involved in cell wall biosynthesis
VSRGGARAPTDAVTVFRGRINVLEYVSIACFVYLLYDLIHSLYQFSAARDVPVTTDAPEDAPLLSVLIPARNEGENIEKCLRHLDAQSYPRIEVVVVDDHSTDDTAGIVQRFQAASQRDVKLVTAGPLRAGWLGKNSALDSGVPHATGQWLLFIDADTELRHPHCITSTLAVARQRRADLFSMMEEQRTESFAERAFLPILFDMVKTHVRMRRVVDESSPEGIACGVYLLFQREAYAAIGGHERVKNTILEDFAFGRIIKESGLRLSFWNGEKLISVRQYKGLKRIWQGWGKNTLGMIGDSPLGYARAIGYLILTNLVPVFLGLSCVGAGLSAMQVALRALPLAMAACYKAGLNAKLKVNPVLYTPLTLTLGACFAILVHLNIVWKYYVRRELSVVDRVYSRQTLSEAEAQGSST